MRTTVPIRIIVRRPMAGVQMKVQVGKSELLDPSVSNEGDLTFDFEIDVDNDGSLPNFLGKFAQGPKAERFVYVNSGSYAGQHFSCFNRRAKISLMTIAADQIKSVNANKDRVLATEFEGIGKDGGPACASIKGIVWKVEKR
ncbi:MAG TPA: DUF5990 family protein [Pyrinomonadaceae bacterium]|nr:DUF5990 family protein [Pyrinomonadaceae bacterium]